MKLKKHLLVTTISCIFLLTGCLQTKFPSNQEIDWITLCVKSHQISDSDIEEFAESIIENYIDKPSWDEKSTFEEIIKIVFQLIFKDEPLSSLVNIGGNYGNEHLQLDYEQMDIIHIEVASKIKKTSTILLNYSALESNTYSPDGNYDLYSFEAIYNGVVNTYVYKYCITHGSMSLRMIHQ